MLSLRSSSHGVKNLLTYTTKSLFLLRPLSSISVADSKPNLVMVDYLVNSLGFSQNDAVSASSKLSHLKSTQNCDSVLDLFKRFDFDNTQIANVVSVAPQVLLHKAHETLEPKFKFFKDLGFSGSDLVRLIKKEPNVLAKGLDGFIARRVKFLREVLGSDDKVVKAINRSSCLLSHTVSVEKIKSNVELLRKCGIKDDKIENLFVRDPGPLLLEPKRLQDVVKRVEGELGIPRDSKLFYHGINVLSNVGKAKLEHKFGIFKSFGWSDSDIKALVRSQPFFLELSDPKINAALQFFMKELGFTPAYLVTHSPLLMHRLESRVKPRYYVLESLKKNKKTRDDTSFYQVVCMSEPDFVEAFVSPFKSEMPEVYKKYINRTK